MRKAETCNTCNQRLDIVRIPTVDGRDSDYRVNLLNLPVLACPANHERRYAYSNFGADLIDGVYYGNKNFFSERKGILKRRDHCYRCHRSLVGIEEAIKVIKLTIRVQEALTFGLEINGPTVTCSGCGNVMISNNPRRVAELSEALAQAMITNSIKP
jgi:hypothetical protein